MVAVAASQIPEIAKHAGDSPEVSNLLESMQGFLVEATRIRYVVLRRSDIPQSV